MSLQLKGKIIAISDEVQLTATFKKREFVIETDGKFPKQICFQATNDRVDILDPYQEGETVEVYFNLESKNPKGSWFTNATAWKIEKQHYNQDSHYEPDEPQF
jgi:hypothetical protein